MPTNAEKIQTRIDNICTELAEMDVTKPGGTANSQAGIDHQGHRRELRLELKELTEQLTVLSGPQVIQTRVR